MSNVTYEQIQDALSMVEGANENLRQLIEAYIEDPNGPKPRDNSEEYVRPFVTFSPGQSIDTPDALGLVAILEVEQLYEKMMMGNAIERSVAQNWIPERFACAPGYFHLSPAERGTDRLLFLRTEIANAVSNPNPVEAQTYQVWHRDSSSATGFRQGKTLERVLCLPWSLNTTEDIGAHISKLAQTLVDQGGVWYEDGDDWLSTFGPES